MNIFRIIFSGTTAIVFGFFALVTGALFVWSMAKIESDTRLTVIKIVGRLNYVLPHGAK